MYCVIKKFGPGRSFSGFGLTGGCSTQLVWMFKVCRHFCSSARRSSDIFTESGEQDVGGGGGGGGAQKQLHPEKTLLVLVGW